MPWYAIQSPSAFIFSVSKNSHIHFSTLFVSYQSKQETTDQAEAAGVKLHPLLHCGIGTMGRNERASFVVTTGDGVEHDGNKDNDNGKTTTELSPRRRFEYDISLDDWVQEIDLSEQQDNSLVKRIIRDGDETTRPVDIAGVTVR